MEKTTFHSIAKGIKRIGGLREVVVYAHWENSHLKLSPRESPLLRRTAQEPRPSEHAN